MSTPEHDRSSAEVRRDIERTRADMNETIDALERRLSPRELADQAWQMIRGEGRGMGDIVREHPVPIALMGLGVAWLAIEQGRADHDTRATRVGSTEPAEGRVGPYRGDAVSSDEGWPHSASRLDHVKEKASDVTGAAREKAHEAREWIQDRIAGAGETAGETRERTREKAHETADRVRHQAGRASRSVRAFMDDSPMAAGAIAFGLGLASGLSIPTTAVEDRLVGERADRLKHRAAEEVKDVSRRTAAVASDAADAARAEAEREGIGEQLGDSAKRIAAEAKHAARERAERENLTGDGLAERALGTDRESSESDWTELR